jgi:hypothetical protein
METTDQRLLKKDWRLNNLYSVAAKEGGRTQKFAPNEAQKLLFKTLDEHQQVILLKSRQLGITTGVTIYFLDEVLFTENINALSIMDKQENAIAAFDNKVRFAWDCFDGRLKELLGWTIDTERANQLTFGFGEDRGISSYMVKNSGRSGTFHRVHVSELAKLSVRSPIDAREIVTGTFPAVPQSGKIIVESTAEGELGEFSDLWVGAVTGKNSFYPLFLNWRLDVAEISLTKTVPVEDLPKEFQELAKDYQLTPQEVSYYYGKWMLLKQDWKILRQEYPTTAEEAFQSTGDKLFDVEIINQLLRFTEDGIVSGKSVIYAPPKKGFTYCIGADVAEGVFKDSSTIVVWEVDGLKTRVVAQYESNEIDPTDFAYVLREFSRTYNNAILAVERNNLGHSVIATLRRIYDENLLYRETQGTNVRVSESTKFGFYTTSVTKPEILMNLKENLSHIYIPSKQILWEMRLCPKSEMTRILTNEKTTRHFDLLMAAAIGLHAAPFAISQSGGGSTVARVMKSNAPFDPHDPI